MKGKVLSFGELLIRISPDIQGDWLNQNRLPFYIGGAELNVATALALWGISSSYLTAVPDNFLAAQIVEKLNRRNILTPNLIYQGNRIGLYFLPKGKDVKNAGVIYDRQHSAFSELTTGAINWEKAFEGVSWFHFSAICPAINHEVAGVCLEALEYASSHGIFISLDLNYREKLWKYGKAPGDIMPVLAQRCNLIMGNIWAAHNMLGTDLNDDLVGKQQKEDYLKHALLSSEEVMRNYPKCEAVANTFRFDYGEEGIRYYTTLYTGGRFYHSREYVSAKIVDKVGSGDCFMAGLIYGFYKKLSPSEILEFATGAAYKKLFIEGDATSSSVADIEEIMKVYAN